MQALRRACRYGGAPLGAPFPALSAVGQLQVLCARSFTSSSSKSGGSTLDSFATLNPEDLRGENTKIFHLLQGQWVSSHSLPITVLDPMTGVPMFTAPHLTEEGIEPFASSLSSCPKSGLHNPLKNPERYLQYGAVCAAAAAKLKEEEVSSFFARLIQRVSPKSFPQAMAEVVVSQQFLENFSGDQVRFLARSFSVPGNHGGQQSAGYRWPYGPVSIISPFNFPLEIPLLQLLGALFMGNKALLKVDTKVAPVMEQALRLLLSCGLPPTDADFVHADGPTMNRLLLKARPQVTQFTGSSAIAEKLSADLGGRVRLEDAGFDWKILGPDVDPTQLLPVAWVCDQDAYACSGQKCSAQSMLFVHKNWSQAGLLPLLSSLAGRRSLGNLTVGPLLSVTTDRFLSHVSSLLSLPGARLLFGGKELAGGAHSIPPCYGAVQPTAVFVPLSAFANDEAAFKIVTTEIFGPLQVVTEFGDGEGEGEEDISSVLSVCERMEAHLTAAVVSNDLPFLQRVLGSTVNGTTYWGRRGRTTGAPQNHWFGPAGDPRAAGIGSPEAIKMVWSCHREIIQDCQPWPQGWTLPEAT